MHHAGSLFYFYTLPFSSFFVIQSEAKALGNIHVNVLVYATEILHYTSFRSE